VHHLSCGVIVFSSALPFLKLFGLLRRQPMLRAVLRMSTSIPRGGRGAGRATRRNHSRPYHVSTTRNSPAAAVAVKPAEPTFTAASIPAVDDRQRHFSERTFADAPISQASKSGIKHQYLSDVQAATLELGLAGKDLLVQAKTGTGKTMAFLLPTVERLAKQPQPPKGSISVLILSPTRELALQVTYYYHRS
jgi:ATP-dependent RNA helicase MSS116